MPKGIYKRVKPVSKETREKQSKTAKRLGFKPPSMLGKHFSEEHKAKISEALKGKSTWNKGKHLTKDWKRKIGEAQKGKIIPIEARIKLSKINKGKKLSKITKERIGEASKQHWQDIDFARKTMEARHTKLNKKELKLYSILQEILPGEYALNIKAEIMILGGKIPDFVNINGQKKVIELYGDYWHRDDDPQDRIDLFQKFGWDALVVWERELKKPEVLTQKVLKFNLIKVK